MDAVLLPIVEARDEESRRAALTDLVVTCAQPTMKNVLDRFRRSDSTFRQEDAEDVLGTATLRLLRKLQDAALDDIENFEGYVAALAYRTVYDFMRRRFPERTRLKNRIRYLLDRDPRFAIWSTSDSVACGLASWKGRENVRDAFEIAPQTASPAMCDSERPHDAVAAIFERAGAPLTLESLVRILTSLWSVAEAHEMSDAIAVENAPSHAATHETRQFLQILWNEIRLLQPQHRTALLLNLRDPEGVNAIALFVLTGVAGIGEIADAVGMSVEELEAIWQSLPLDDLAIAARLGLTRQQVINLRRTARERLARRALSWTSNERRRG